MCMHMYASIRIWGRIARIQMALGRLEIKNLGSGDVVWVWVCACMHAWIDRDPSRAVRVVRVRSCVGWGGRESRLGPSRLFYLARVDVDQYLETRGAGYRSGTKRPS